MGKSWVRARLIDGLELGFSVDRSLVVQWVEAGLVGGWKLG